MTTYWFEDWGDRAKFIAGGLIGWAAHPRIWPVAGPLRWLSLLASTASQESGFYVAAYNPEETGSRGIYQFQTSTWEAISNRDVSDASDPFWATYTAATYFSETLKAGGRWYKVALPWIGDGWIRSAWKGPTLEWSADQMANGFTDRDGDKIPGWEENAKLAFKRWRLVTAPLGLLIVGLVVWGAVKLRKGRR